MAIGGISGAIALGIAPVFEESKVPFIAYTPTETFDMNLKPKAYWTFRTNWTPPRRPPQGWA